jgi:hypothetical protein
MGKTGRKQEHNTLDGLPEKSKSVTEHRPISNVVDPYAKNALKTAFDDIYQLRRDLGKIKTEEDNQPPKQDISTTYEVVQTFPAPPPPINDNDSTYFWAVYVSYPQGPAGTNPAASPANNVIVYEFVLPFSFTISQITIEITTARVSTNKVGVGLYNSDGNLLVQTGALNTGSLGFYVTPVSPVTVDAGKVFFAQTTNDISLSCRTMTLISQFADILNHTTIRIGTSNQSPPSAGVLPATIGTLTAAINNRPIIATLFE